MCDTCKRHVDNMLCREQFLKYPPENYTKSQLLDQASEAKDDDANKLIRSGNQKFNSEDISNWMTDDESTQGEYVEPRRRRKKLYIAKQEIEFHIMKKIFESQTDEVKEVILRLHQMQITQKKKNATREPIPPVIVKKKKFVRRVAGKKKKSRRVAVSAAPGALQNNRKILARIQRGRHHRGKPRSSKKCKRSKRKNRSRGCKKGNRQRRKRVLRANKLFNKGVFLTRKKLLDSVWQSIIDPNSTAISFCNNKTHALSKAHKKQIALYERIEEDLHRLDIAREERNKAALERKAKEKEKEALRQKLKNKIEVRAAERAERDALRRERRAARKERVLQKKMRLEKAKADEITT